MKRVGWHALKSTIMAFVAYAIVRMWHWKIGFTYFTQLSNIFAAFAVAVQLLLEGKSGHAAAIVRGIKFAATVSITVTGVVFLTALAPMDPDGFVAAYRQDGWASLCMHGIVPILMLTDFLMHDAMQPFSREHALIALIPPALYLLLVLALGATGMRWGHGTMAGPYPFLNYESPVGWFGFDPASASATTAGLGIVWSILLMLLFLAAIGLALVAASHRRSKGRDASWKETSR